MLLDHQGFAVLLEKEPDASDGERRAELDRIRHDRVEFFDLDAVVTYAVKLGSALTVARVGFFLEQHREPLMVEEHHLEALRTHAPRQPTYLDRRRQSGRLVSRWNLVVPERVLSRAWGEVP